jgi:molybdopterin synthase catalytic subunit
MAEQQEKMTIEDLAGKVDDLTGTVNNLAGTVNNLAGTVDTLAKSIENLAGMTQRGFSEVHEKMDKGFAEQSKRSDILEDGQGRLEEKQTLLEYGQKETRKEIANLTKLIEKSTNEEEIVTLKHRVTLLEAQLAK